MRNDKSLKVPYGAGMGPTFARKSPWQISDGIDYVDADTGFQSGEPAHNGAIGNSAKSWSDRGFADDYADNPVQAPGYLKSPRWRGADYIQDEQRHYYTNPFPTIPWGRWPRYAANSTRQIDTWEGVEPMERSVGTAPTMYRLDGPSGVQANGGVNSYGS